MSGTRTKILIFTAGFGEGHNTAARNIKQGLEYVGKDGVEVVMLDAFATCYGETNEFTRKLYIDAINKTPRLWQLVYNLLDKTELFDLCLPLMEKLEAEIAEILKQHQPDIVCSTYPVYNFLIKRIFPDPDKRPFQQVTMVTDSISVNSLWYRAPSDIWVVPNEHTADVMAEAGTPREKLRVFGFPVQLAFHLPEAKQTPPDPAMSQAKVLYIINSGKQQAPDTVKAILTRTDVHLTISVGRDETLRQLVMDSARGYENRITLIGWTDQMPQLMMSHNLMITKAGGATVQEALAACCPLIINQVVPGQEEGNWELVKRLDGGILARGPEAVSEAVHQAFSGGGSQVKAWRENLLAACRADSAIQMAVFLLEDLPER